MGGFILWFIFGCQKKIVTEDSGAETLGLSFCQVQTHRLSTVDYSADENAVENPDASFEATFAWDGLFQTLTAGQFGNFASQYQSYSAQYNELGYPLELHFDDVVGSSMLRSLDVLSEYQCDSWCRLQSQSMEYNKDGDPTIVTYTWDGLTQFQDGTDYSTTYNELGYVLESEFEDQMGLHQIQNTWSCSAEVCLHSTYNHILNNPMSGNVEILTLTFEEVSTETGHELQGVGTLEINGESYAYRLDQKINLHGLPTWEQEQRRTMQGTRQMTSMWEYNCP